MSSSKLAGIILGVVGGFFLVGCLGLIGVVATAVLLSPGPAYDLEADAGLPELEPTSLGDDDFHAAVEGQPRTLVQFHAEWCDPCQAFKPTVRRFAAERAGRLQVVQVDIDAAPEIASEYGIHSIPAVVLLEDGREIDRVFGGMSRAELADWVDSHEGS